MTALMFFYQLFVESFINILAYKLWKLERKIETLKLTISKYVAVWISNDCFYSKNIVSFF